MANIEFKVLLNQNYEYPHTRTERKRKLSKGFGTSEYVLPDIFKYQVLKEVGER